MAPSHEGPEPEAVEAPRPQLTFATRPAVRMCSSSTPTENAIAK
jgi:hypothetical protein